MAVCNARRKRCKGCERRFTAEETQAGVENCPQCGQARGHCQAQAVTGSEKCRHHGGKSLKGIAHPNFQGRGHTKNFPKGLLDSYNRAMSDPDILNLKHEMATVHAVSEDTLRKINGGESADKWRLLKRYVKQYRNAADREGEEDAFDLIEQCVNDGSVDFAARTVVLKAVDQYRKLHDSTIKKMQATGGTFTGEQVLHLIMTFMLGVKRIVQDRSQLNAIADLYDSIVDASSRPVAEIGDGRGYTGDDEYGDDGAIPAEVVSGDPGLQRQEA